MAQEHLSVDEFNRSLGKLPHKRQEPEDKYCLRGVIYFVIPGEPIGKPRMTRRDKWKQRPSVMKYRQWADLARHHAGTIPPGVIRLDWKAVFSPPKTWSKKRRAAAIGMPHRSRPDRDNIDKAILDALFDDDSGIASGFINKVWGEEPRLEVWIELTPNPESDR